MEAPQVGVTRGTPTPAEDQAARAAILELWRTDVADAVRARGASPWVLAGRARATRRGPEAVRARTGDGWRLAGHLGPSVSHFGIGRGDAR